MWFWNKALSQSTHTLLLFTWAMGTCICTSPVSVSAASNKYIQICIQPYDQICLLISCAALQGLPTCVQLTNLGLGCRYSVKFMLSIYCLIYTRFSPFHLFGWSCKAPATWQLRSIQRQSSTCVGFIFPVEEMRCWGTEQRHDKDKRNVWQRLAQIPALLIPSSASPRQASPSSEAADPRALGTT